MIFCRKIAFAAFFAVHNGMMRIAEAMARFTLSVAPPDKQMEIKQMANKMPN